MTSSWDEPAIKSIKLQKKGTKEIITLNISEVGTWDSFLKVLKEHFQYTDDEPQITTFNGNLISSAEDYGARLEPGLHLIVYFPPTLAEITELLGMLFVASRSGVSPSPYRLPTPDPFACHLGTYLSPHLEPPPPKKPRKHHFQAPTIYFTVPAPTAIKITLSSSSFKHIANENNEHPDDPFAAVPQYQNFTPPSLPKSEEYSTSESEGISPNSTNMTDRSSPSAEAFDTNVLLPPWTEVPIHSQVEGMGLGSSAYRLAFSGRFPVTSFDLFSQSHKKRAIYSISWDVVAFPEGGLEDIISGEAMPSISWAVSGGVDDREYGKTSEKRTYGSSEGPLRSAYDTGDSQDADWWMVELEKLPTKFSGEAGEHTFLLNSVAEVAAHLNAFMKRCGIAEDVIEGFVNYWTQNLESPHDDDPPNAVSDRGPTSTSVSTPKLILLKFLHPQELQNYLPMSFLPTPHRTVRLFAVFRVIGRQEIDAEDIGAYGDFEMEVSRVVGNIGSCGGGRNCGHRGINVAEVGGVRVFEDQDG